jgi:hypothetical protein
MPGVVNEGAMAVLQPRLALAAFIAHGPRIAGRADKAWMPRPLPPAEFVEPVVVDAEVMCDLVDHGDRDLVDDLVLVLADLQ